MTSIGTRKKVVDFQKILISKIEGDISDDNTRSVVNNKETVKGSKSKPKRSNLLKSKRNREKDEQTEKDNNENLFQIDKREHADTMAKFAEEYNELGLAQEQKIQEQTRINITFAKLIIDLFSMTKFENSKPHKMIDYIYNNDRSSPLSDLDKGAFEKLKKKVFISKAYDINSNPAIFKSLYQYFKVDFTSSRVVKIFESVNRLINEAHATSLQAQGSNGSGMFVNTTSFNQAEQELEEEASFRAGDEITKIGSLGGFEEEVDNKQKDKFTYQRFISDKLRSYTSSGGIENQLNDSELYKSLIYLCNKNYRNYPKPTVPAGKQSSKQEQEFVQNLNNNLHLLKEAADKKHIPSGFFSKIKAEMALSKTKRRIHLYTKRTFGFSKMRKVNFKCLKYLMELLLRFKEDDTATIHEKLKESIADLELDRDDVKIVSLYFKIFFQMKNLRENKTWINDEKYWKIVNDFFKSSATISPPKTKARKKHIQNPGESNDEHSNANKKKKSKANGEPLEAQDKNDETVKSSRTKENTKANGPRMIFLVFKDKDVDEMRSRDSSLSKAKEVKVEETKEKEQKENKDTIEPKKRKRRTKKEIQEETEFIEKNKEKSVSNEEKKIFDVKIEDQTLEQPVNPQVEASEPNDQEVKVKKPRKKRKTKSEMQEEANKTELLNNEAMREYPMYLEHPIGDKAAEIPLDKPPKPKKPRKKPVKVAAESSMSFPISIPLIGNENPENDIEINNVDLGIGQNPMFDIPILDPGKEVVVPPKKRGRQKKMNDLNVPRVEGLNTQAILNINDGETSGEVFKISNLNSGNEGQTPTPLEMKAAKPKKQRKPPAEGTSRGKSSSTVKHSMASNGGSINFAAQVGVNPELLNSSPLFASPGLDQPIYVNQFQSPSSTINNNISNNISINNNYNNPEIKNINIVYNGNPNNRLQFNSFLTTPGVSILSLELLKNLAGSINQVPVPNFESFFESANSEPTDSKQPQQNNANLSPSPTPTTGPQIDIEPLKIDPSTLPFLNIPVIIPMNDFLNHNAQSFLNPKYNPVFYNNFYQKIMDYNKNVAAKISTDESIPQKSTAKQKRKYQRKKKNQNEASHIAEQNGLPPGGELRFEDFLIKQEVLNEVEQQKNMGQTKKRIKKKAPNEGGSAGDAKELDESAKGDYI